ncbi:hypothetical protein HOV93_43210 [Planctomycetes bacterium FF15]|uniref:Uncharacterized protein n=1 Tax=Bremerella alba TaxID=980252 RepID=A0A7V9A940_9BACT|nr:hypothetical protein [Bremerella alba]
MGGRRVVWDGPHYLLLVDSVQINCQEIPLNWSGLEFPGHRPLRKTNEKVLWILDWFLCVRQKTLL